MMGKILNADAASNDEKSAELMFMEAALSISAGTSATDVSE